MQALTGTRVLLRTTARQDVRNIGPWVAVVSALSVTSLIGYRFVFPDEQSRQGLALTVGSNPAFSLVFGTPYDLTIADGFNAWRSLALGGFFTALMAILTVVRNSRADEDSGQAELVASGVVGRHARLATAVALACLASLGVGVVSAVLTLVFGGDPMATVALSSTFTVTGIMFAGVAAVAAQLGSYARTATTLAVGVLGVSYLARGFADAAPDAGWLIWWTPLGWMQEVRPAAGDDWAMLLPGLLFAAVMVGIANALLARRDFGMGLIPPRAGPARGRPGQTSAWGLALRLHANSVLAWTVAFVVLGSAFGYLASSLGSVLGPDSPLAQVFASGGASVDLAFAFVLTLLQLMGIIAAVYGVQVMMRVHAEETEYRLEPLLATAVGRSRLYASHAVIALVGPSVALIVGGIAISVTAGSSDTSITTEAVVRQVLVELPAVAVLIGVAIATIGARPRVRLASWAAVVATFALTLLGPLFNLWDWILGISPLWHVPNITAPTVNLWPVAVLATIATVLIAVGFAGFRHRDVI